MSNERDTAREELRQLRGELKAALPRLSGLEADLAKARAELKHTREQLDDSWDQLRALRRSPSFRLSSSIRLLGGRR